MDRNFDLIRVSGPDSNDGIDDDSEEMEFSEEEAADAETAP